MVYSARIEPSSEEKNRQAAEEQYRKRQLRLSRTLNVISGIGAGIAFMALLGVWYYACLTRQANVINKRADDLAYRPYVGAGGLFAKCGFKDMNGNTHLSQSLVKACTFLDFTAEIKNFGPVPATNYTARWRVFVGGIERRGSGIPDKPTTLFPGEALYLTGQIGTNDYPSVISGEKNLICEITIQYEGPNGHHTNCSKHAYSPRTNAFLNLGACGGPKG